MGLRESYDRSLARWRPVVRTVPGAAAATDALERLVKLLVRGFYRFALFPFGKLRRAPDRAHEVDIEARTDAFNEAAERYFAEFPDPDFLIGKPFTEPEGFADRLFCLGVLCRGVRLAPEDVVLDFGAGPCWMSHFVHRFGCRTISVDVSPTALELGRRLFESDPRTDWTLEPQFLTYDGHTLPLPDASCDKILVNDAFHHVPNPREILAEFHRVLRPDGIVGMREPGQDHAAQPVSRQEAATGVLENDIVIEELARVARDCGFRDVTLIPTALEGLVEIDAADLKPFLQGKGFVYYWTNLGNALQNEHFVFLHRQAKEPTTRAPRALRAEIWTARRHRRRRLRTGERGSFDVWVRNVGDTRWLGADHRDGGGWTRLGGHLADGGGGSLDFDWLRVELPRDVDPGEEVKLEVPLPPIVEPGDYRLQLEMVVEGRCWFSPAPDDIELRVEGAAVNRGSDTTSP